MRSTRNSSAPDGRGVGAGRMRRPIRMVPRSFGRRAGIACVGGGPSGPLDAGTGLPARRHGSCLAERALGRAQAEAGGVE